MENMNKGENWKVIQFALQYECSDLGNVRNKNSKQVLKFIKTPDGYVKNTIKFNEGKRVGMFTHRIIALVWLENPENKKTIDHD